MLSPSSSPFSSKAEATNELNSVRLSIRFRVRTGSESRTAVDELLER